jgi:hypothetical protein
LGQQDPWKSDWLSFVDMEAVSRTLDNGTTSSADYLFLKVRDRQQQDALRHLRVGDSIHFATTVDVGKRTFPVLMLDYDEVDRIIFLQLGVTSVQLIS